MIICPVCGEEDPENARFCVSCGSPLSAEGAGEGDERKLVTVMFAELVGFRTSTGEFDPEDLKRVLEPYHVRVRRVVTNHGEAPARDRCSSRSTPCSRARRRRRSDADRVAASLRPCRTCPNPSRGIPSPS